MVLFVVVTTAGVLGSAFSPYLLVHHPLALIALAPDIRHLVLVAADTPFGPVLGVGGVRRALGLLTTYGMGALYGPALVQWTVARHPRTGALVRVLERLFERFGAALLILWPFYAGGLLAGAAKYPVSRFLPAMALGQLGYITASYYVGDSLSAWTGPFIQFLSEHLVASTAVCVAAVAGQQLWSRWRERGRADAEGEF